MFGKLRNSHSIKIELKMRGLNIRCDFALNKVLFDSDPENLTYFKRKQKAAYEAQNMGKLAAWEIEQSCPFLFADEPLLATQFAWGLHKSLSLGVNGLVEEIANEANKGCGQIYELFCERFSEAIDGYLSRSSSFRPEFIEEFMRVALSAGYATPKEIEAGRRSSCEGGLCMRHLDPDCCPVGCGDIEKYC